MTADEIMDLLPHQVDKNFLRKVEILAGDELGGDLLICGSERVELLPGLEDLMYYQQTRGKKVWAARCHCTACKDEFITKKHTGAKAIELMYGDDGCSYTMEPDADSGIQLDIDEYPGDMVCSQVVNEWEETYCPLCGSKVKMTWRESVRGGRTKAMNVAQLLAIGGYAVILYWLVCRQIGEHGIERLYVNPMDAYVLAEKKRILHFTHGRIDRYGNWHDDSLWRRTSRTYDVWDRIFHDWGSTYNRKSGVYLYPDTDSMVGTTGEKTGVFQYWKAEGDRPVEYLKLWKRYPSLENLIHAGCVRLVSELVERIYNYHHIYDADTELRKVIDPDKRKPHEMLRMTKAEFQKIPREHITLRNMEVICSFKQRGYGDSADRILELVKREGTGVTMSMMKAMGQSGCLSMDRTVRYMKKQGCHDREIHVLVDTRSMAQRLNDGAPLTQEELWPRQLMVTHDRLAELITLQEQKEKAEEYQRGFDRVLETCGSIEWTDGDLCIRLPRCNEDLVQEGQILRHCVGGYGKSHSEGQNLIFFVRRYRRPERSYYTLNISMGLEPKEIQLHGYGNERHGDKKQYSHKIPKKVRDFCNRWEREVLAPYCRSRYKENKKEKSA